MWNLTRSLTKSTATRLHCTRFDECVHVFVRFDLLWHWIHVAHLCVDFTIAFDAKCVEILYSSWICVHIYCYESNWIESPLFKIIVLFLVIYSLHWIACCFDYTLEFVLTKPIEIMQFFDFGFCFETEEWKKELKTKETAATKTKNKKDG